jgi:hypothetical protein
MKKGRLRIEFYVNLAILVNNVIQKGFIQICQCTRRTGCTVRREDAQQGLRLVLGLQESRSSEFSTESGRDCHGEQEHLAYWGEFMAL